MKIIQGPDLYKHDLLDAAKNPLNYGLLKDADFCSARLNPSCGDSVTICGLVSGDRLQKVTFEGVGCVLSLAMASKLTVHVIDMPLDQIALLDDQTVEKLLGLELGINRLQCGMLSIMALEQGVREFLTNRSNKI